MKSRRLTREDEIGSRDFLWSTFSEYFRMTNSIHGNGGVSEGRAGMFQGRRIPGCTYRAMEYAVDGSIHYRIARLYLKIDNKTAADNALRFFERTAKAVG